VTVHAGPSGRILDTIDRKLGEVEWLLNYARNANKLIPVASAPPVAILVWKIDRYHAQKVGSSESLKALHSFNELGAPNIRPNASDAVVHRLEP
jgi:hypothetical protein